MLQCSRRWGNRPLAVNARMRDGDAWPNRWCQCKYSVFSFGVLRPIIFYLCCDVHHIHWFVGPFRLVSRLALVCLKTVVSPKALPQRVHVISTSCHVHFDYLSCRVHFDKLLISSWSWLDRLSLSCFLQVVLIFLLIAYNKVVLIFLLSQATASFG